MTKETGKHETIEEMQGIVAQRKFATLEEFRKRKNNFYAHFMTDGNSWAEDRRKRSHFQRFQMMYPELVEKLGREVCEAESEGHEKYSSPLLHKAYNLMSQLVFENDEGLQSHPHPDQYLTC